MRSEQLNKIVYKAAQIRVASQAYTGCARLEQMARIDQTQPGIPILIKSHFCEDAYSNPEFDVSLDHIRIDCRKRNIRLDVPCVEGFANRSVGVEGEVVGYDRVAGDRFKGERLFADQCVP